MQLLSDLIARAGIVVDVTGDAAVRIQSLTADSRQVTPGALFVAMPGVQTDGTAFIAEAIRRGAVAVMLAEGAAALDDVAVTLLRVRDVRAAVSAFAAAFYPEQPRYVMAVTGTDGKTSTADFVRQLVELSGHKAASIGTLGLRSPDAAHNAAFPAVNTSPEPILLHKTLAALAAKNIDYLAVEASSHGLDQKRLDGVTCCAAAFTNLARDHLDYHPSLEAYFEAKARLFTQVLPAGAVAVLNRDDARYAALHALCEARGIAVISFGYHPESTYRIVQVTPHADGLRAQLMLRNKTYDIALPLYGAFQLSNMLAAIGLLHGAGMEEVALIGLLPKLSGVPGRLERVATVRGAPVFVDYAHTPAALQNILTTLRSHTAKKLHVVFGCGGNRDAGKRPEMGAVAAQYADNVIVTDDNPRDENPATIRAAVLAAAPGASAIADRAEAIRTAVQQLHTGDVLVVAGKGHETTQIIGTQVIHFNDADEIRKAVAA